MIVGGVAYLAAAPLIGDIAGHALSRSALASGTVVAVGAALGPDFDTRQSTMAHSLGPVSLTLATVVGKLSGGHRNGTHSFLFCAIAFALTTLALAQAQIVKLPYGHTISAGLIVGLIVAFCSLALAFSHLLRLHGPRLMVLVLSLLLIAVLLKPGTEWMPGAVLVGTLSHLLADGVTPEGIPPFWPFWRRRFHVSLIGHTGDGREKLIVALVIVGGLLLGSHEFRHAPTARAAPIIRPVPTRPRPHTFCRRPHEHCQSGCAARPRLAGCKPQPAGQPAPRRG